MFNDFLASLYHAVFSTFWYIFVWFPFNILKIIVELFKFLGINKVKDILFGQNDSWEIPVAFQVFLLLAITLSIFFVIFGITRYLLKPNEEVEGQNSLKLAIKNVIPAFLAMFAIPLITYASFILLQILLDWLMLALGGDEDLTKAIFKILKPQNEVITDEIWDKVAATGYKVLDKTPYLKLAWGEGIQIFLFSVVVFVLIILFMFNALLNMTGKVVKVFLLFITLPPTAVSMITDGGQRFKEWKNQFIQNIATVFIYQIIIVFFFIWIQLANDLAAQFVGQKSGFFLFFVKVALWAGATFVIDDIVQTMANLIGYQIQNFKSINDTSKRLGTISKTTGAAAIAAGVGASKKTFGVDQAIAGFKSDLKSGKITKDQYKEKMQQYKEDKKANSLGWTDTRTNGLLYKAKATGQNIKHKGLSFKNWASEATTAMKLKTNKKLTHQQKDKMQQQAIVKKWKNKEKQMKIEDKQAKVKDFNNKYLQNKKETKKNLNEIQNETTK